MILWGVQLEMEGSVQILRPCPLAGKVTERQSCVVGKFKFPFMVVIKVYLLTLIYVDGSPNAAQGHDL